jgi:hypothetical protein
MQQRILMKNTIREDLKYLKVREVILVMSRGTSRNLQSKTEHEDGICPLGAVLYARCIAERARGALASTQIDCLVANAHAAGAMAHLRHCSVKTRRVR